MKLVEYKKIKAADGQLINPPWLVVGDLFNDNSLNTFIGLVLEESDRNYSVPDNLTYLNKEQLIQRLLPQHNVRKFTKKNVANGEITRVEFNTVEEFVNYWFVKNNIN